MNDFMRQMLRAWPVPLLIGVLFAGLAYQVGSTRAPASIGQSGVTLKWVEEGTSPGASFRDPLETLTPGYQGLAESPGFLDPILQENGIAEPASALVLGKRLLVTTPGPNLILVMVENSSAERASATALDIAEELAATINSEQPADGGAQAEVLAATSSPARLAISPALVAVAGFLAGAVIGVLLVLAWVSARRRVLSHEGLVDVVAGRATDIGTLAYPALGAIPAGNRATAVRLDHLISERAGGNSVCVIGDDTAAVTQQAEALAAALRESGVAAVAAGDTAKQVVRPDFATIVAGRYVAPEPDASGPEYVIVPVTAAEEDLMTALIDRWADIVVIAVRQSKTRVSWLDRLLADWPSEHAPAVVLSVDKR